MDKTRAKKIYEQSKQIKIRAETVKRKWATRSDD